MPSTVRRGLITGAVLTSLAVAASSCSSAHTGTNAASSCSASPGRAVTGGQSRRSGPGDITKIRHVIVIMQENRSFDQYFGTYPRADGIPRRNGTRLCASATPRVVA